VAATHVAYEAEGWGVGEVWLEDGRVVWHELPRARRGPSQPPTHPRGRGRIGPRRTRERDDLAPFVVDAICEYLAGRRATLDDVPVDLEYPTSFHRRCAAALRAVPRGEVVTYGELAALAGAPGAARAAGSFCARNRLGLFVPCHRVVGASGLGSYGSLGLAYKRRLLELEHAAL
jgi:methylated-DNA-[protein]-cysteine S-methyltransferase